MLAFVGLAAQVFIGILSLIQTIIVFVMIKQLKSLGAKYDIRIWKNGGEKSKEGK